MSAGIEKFYTLPQFLAVEVTFLCQVGFVIAIVRLLAYGRPGARRTRDGLLLGFLLLWCLEEMLCAVAPSAQHLRFTLYAGSILPLMPALLLAGRPRSEGPVPAVVLYPVLFVALFAAVVIVDRVTGLVLAPRGLLSLPEAQPLYWAPPSAAIALAVCAAVADLVRRERRAALDAGVILAYGSYFASRLTPFVLPVDPFVLVLPVATALIIRGVEVPAERVLTVSRARDVMRCLPESIFVYAGDMSLAGNNGGPLTGLLTGCRTLGETLDKLRSISSRWTLEGFDEQSLMDPAESAVYVEGDFSLAVPSGDGVTDFSIGLGPVRDPAGFQGCVLVLQDITAHRSALREAERAYAELRLVQERLEHYAQATMPREVERDNRERMGALRARTRERLQAAASEIGALRHEHGSGAVPRERIVGVAESVRACLSDVRNTVSRLRSSS